MANMTAVLARPRAEDPAHEWVHRFGPTERFAHWWVVSLVSVALLTGLLMGEDFRGNPLRWVHVGAVVLIFVGLTAALVVGDRRALARAAGTLFVLDGAEAHWLLTRLRHPLRPTPHHRWGMFNPAQKVAAWGVAGALSSVILTGVQAWRGGLGGGLHAATVVVTALLLGAHVFMAVLNPTTRPALAGMLFGRVPRAWAAQHHGGWLDEHPQR